MGSVSIWIICFLSIAGVIIRPFKWPEVIWAAGGAIVLVVSGLIRPADGLAGITKGLDVYLFLTGMMLLAETAREERLFDWLAAQATRLAKGSSRRLFLLIYGVGVVVTVFLSNDATAVVLTPAVAAAVKAAKVEKPLPYLLICAFIANAASFVLPISNPANLVIYGSRLPSLAEWLPSYMLPSIFSIVITFFALRFTQRRALLQTTATDIMLPELSAGGVTALLGIFFTALVLLVCSARGMQLGMPTAIAGALTSVIVLVRGRKNPMIVIKEVTWSVIPLVAGLFVLVEGLNKTGVIKMISAWLQENAGRSVPGTAYGAGLVTALGSNLLNNLPAGLIAADALQAAPVPDLIRKAVLIGIDLGPNLSVTGSLATILWLVALRREGISVSGWTFLKIGSLVMTAALLCALAALWI